MMHWSAKYVCLRYAEVGRCWGLVQMVCMNRFGVMMPLVDPESDDDQAGAIREASRVSGWRPAESGPVADDIAVMIGPGEKRHAGFVVEADGEIQLLHAKGRLVGDAQKGEVICQPWHELAASGFHSFEFWRRS